MVSFSSQPPPLQPPPQGEYPFRRLALEPPPHNGQRPNLDLSEDAKGKQSVESTGPMLSMIWLPLRDDAEIYDQSKAASRLWIEALDYISVIPGCREIYWGQGLEGDLPALLLLVQWYDASFWDMSQLRRGISLISDILRANPFNQAARLHISTLIQPEQIVELSILALKSIDDVDCVTKSLTNLYQLAAEKAEITYYSNKLEQDVPWLVSEGQPDDGEAKSIISLVVWAREAYQAALANQQLQDKARSLLSNISSFRRYTASLKRFKFIDFPPIPPPVNQVQARSTAELVSLQVFRRNSFTRDQGRNIYKFIREKDRQMVPSSSPGHPQQRQTLILNTFQVQYATIPYSKGNLVLPPELSELLDKIRAEIKLHSGCRDTALAKVQYPGYEDERNNSTENLSICQLLIFWENGTPAPERIKARTKIVDALESLESINHTILVSEIPGVLDTFNLASETDVASTLYELVSFDIAPENQELFQNLWITFARLSKLEHITRVGDYSRYPVSYQGGGWSEKAVETPYLRFTGIRAWRNADTVVPWFYRYAQLALGILGDPGFMWLGTLVDAIHLTTHRKPVSTFLSVREPVQPTPPFVFPSWS